MRQLAQTGQTSFPIAGGIFTVRRGYTLFTLLILAALLVLGFWQVERLEWKEQLIRTISARIKELPQDVRSLSPLYWHADGRPDTDRLAVTELDYRPASAIGQFLYGGEMFMTSTSMTGEGGYQVLTPMQLEDGRWLLIDRGWIPYSRRPGTTNNHAAGFARPTGVVQVAGLLRLPQHRWLQPTNKPASGEWYGIDLPAMAQAAGISGFLPFVLYADSDPNAGGFPVGGQTRLDLPNNHLVYALTWFGLALGLICVYVVSSWRGPERAKPTKLVTTPDTVAATDVKTKVKRGKPAWVSKLFDPPVPPPKPPLFPRSTPAAELLTPLTPVKPRRTRRKQVAEPAPVAGMEGILGGGVTAEAAASAEAAPKPARKRRRKTTIEPAAETGVAAAPVLEAGVEVTSEAAPVEIPAKKRVRRSRKKIAAQPETALETSTSTEGRVPSPSAPADGTEN